MKYVITEALIDDGDEVEVDIVEVKDYVENGVPIGRKKGVVVSLRNGERGSRTVWLTLDGVSKLIRSLALAVQDQGGFVEGL